MTDFWDKAIDALDSEADVELRIVVPLLHALGYEDDDIAAKYPVVFQEGRVGRRPEADYVCFAGPLKNRDTSLCVVEAKKPGEALPPGKVQCESYARNLLAPVLMLTNGETLEIWQIQPTQESVRVLDVPISALSEERAKVEQFLGKAALVAYCKSLAFKTILEASADYGAYEAAELKRTAHRSGLIERTLQQLGSNRPEDRIDASRLIDGLPEGATIVAASGYGKTTLANSLFREAIEARWRKQRIFLAFDIPLPDLAQMQLGVLTFLHTRLSAHCPGVSVSTLKQILRDTGATLICDSFDRVSVAYRTTLTTELSTFIRDYPKVQLFVFSRQASRPRVDLPILELEALTDDQMRSIERATLDEGNKHYSVIDLMPEVLRTLCKTPLLLEQALAFWKLDHTFPTQLQDLFESWLSNMLKAEPSDVVTAIEREQGLTIIAKATTISPIAGGKALELFKEFGLRSEVLNDLINCDAICVTGSVVELQHEAMADYLRAREVASLQESLALDRLATLPVVEGTLFPILLMALLPTNRLQSAWWRRLSETNIKVYGDALRYRYDVSAEMKKLPPEDLSRDYLADLLDGIEIPLSGIFSELRRTVAEHLLNSADGSFAVTGVVHADQSHVSYMLHPRDSFETPRVRVGLPTGAGTFRGVNLELSNMRLDSGRLLGTTLLGKTILAIVKQQQLKGGPVWAADRLIGRVRYLAKTCGFPIALDASLDTVAATLMPHRDQLVYVGSLSDGISFSIQSLFDDIEALRAASVHALDPWWHRLGWDNTAPSQNEEVIIHVLNEHYRRVQVAYAEIINTTFSGHAKEMSFYTAVPVRWDLTVRRGAAPSSQDTIYYSIFPVASWEEAGAVTQFSDSPPDFLDFEKVRKRLAELGRSTSNFGARTGGRRFFRFDGRQWTGRFDGATTVVHEVCEILKDELTRLFSVIP
jgi:hypothetical protein